MRCGLGAGEAMSEPDIDSLSTMRLVWPARDYLAEYVAALERGWSPDNLRQEAAHQDAFEHWGFSFELRAARQRVRPGQAMHELAARNPQPAAPV